MIDRIFIIIVILSGAALCPAADNGFERALLPLLENHCFVCHDEDTQKGGLALRTLNRRPRRFFSENACPDPL